MLILRSCTCGFEYIAEIALQRGFIVQPILAILSLLLVYSRPSHLFPETVTKSKKVEGEQKRSAFSAAILEADILGAVLIVCAVLAPTIALTFRSDGVPWSDLTVAVPLALTPLLWGIFVSCERYVAKEPIVKFELFTRNGLSPTLGCIFFVLMAHNAVGLQHSKLPAQLILSQGIVHYVVLESNIEHRIRRGNVRIVHPGLYAIIGRRSLFRWPAYQAQLFTSGFAPNQPTWTMSMLW